MREHKTDRISREANALVSCVTHILDEKKAGYETKAGDLSHTESIWSEIFVRTRTESALTFVLQLFRDAVVMFCNDYQIFIYISEKPSDPETWMIQLRRILTAVFRRELRIRGRKSILSGKTAAIWLEFPEGGRWMGDRKACRGAGKEFVFKNWF